MTSTEDIGKAVQDQYVKDTHERAKVDSFRINKDGLISFTDSISDTTEQSFEINYAEQLGIDDFLQISDKLFSIKELENLLGSTSHYHKLYALRLIKTCLEVTFNNSDIKKDFSDQHKHVWEILLNEEYTHIVKYIEMCGQTQRSDFSQIILELRLQMFRGIF